MKPANFAIGQMLDAHLPSFSKYTNDRCYLTHAYSIDEMDHIS